MSAIKQNWQKIELGEILSISSKKFNPIGNNENKKCVELEHLSQETGKLLGYTNSSEQQSIKNSFEEGQVLFGKLRPYLKKFWKAEFKGVCSSEIWVMSGKKVKNDFLFYLVQIEKFNQIANVSSGSKMPRADWNYMAEIPFDVPPLKEQEKIAEILTTWDEAITKQEQLLKAKELQKKALMQKLLSGEVRFSGFSDEWEEVRLGEIAEIYQPQTISQTELTNDGFDVYGANGIIGKYHQYNHELEQIAVTCRGNTCGTVNFTNPKSWITGNAMVINLDNSTKAIKTFIYYLFLNTNFTYLISGSGQPQITGNIKNHKLKLPSLYEQQKIAEVLSLADDEINLLKNSLVELKLQKKALMQKLLTGQVRVKV